MMTLTVAVKKQNPPLMNKDGKKIAMKKKIVTNKNQSLLKYNAFFIILTYV